MKRAIGLIACSIVAFGNSTADASDQYQVEGTAQEKHAQQIFAGVFGQCRAPVSQAEGVVALVFEVRASGKFMATSTFNDHKGKDALRELALCMGGRANSARPFPQSDGTSLVGVKFSVHTDGTLLMMGTGEATTLGEAEIFTWARQKPTTPGV